MEEKIHNCNKTFDEIQKSFQDNLVVVSIKSSNTIPKGKTKYFTSKIQMIRKKMERSAIAFIDGDFYMLLNNYRKQRVSIVKGSEEIDLKTLVNETVLEIQDYYHKKKISIDDLFEIKLIVRPFPVLNINQYKNLHKINEDIDKNEVLKDFKEYIDNLTFEIYKQLKDNLMYRDVETNKGIVKLEDVLKDNEELLDLTKTVKGKYSRDDYYKDHNFEKPLIDEIERQRAIWYYYKISKKKKEGNTIRPKVLDGFYSLKEKADFFYDSTEDQDFKKQYDMILETDRLIEDK